MKKILALILAVMMMGTTCCALADETQGMPLYKTIGDAMDAARKTAGEDGDVIAGMAAGKADFIQECTLFGLKDMTGAVMGPQEAFLILRGLKTMEIRMQRHCENAAKLVEYLQTESKVTEIDYPGLATHPGHDIAAKQMHNGFGGMVSIKVKGGKAAGMKFVNSLKMCVIAVSLGDAETLVEHLASMTHSTYSPEELKAADIDEGLVRISVGLENIEDIIADFKQAFAQI